MPADCTRPSVCLPREAAGLAVPEHEDVSGAGCQGPLEVDNAEMMLERIAHDAEERGDGALEERADRVLLSREPGDTLALCNLAEKAREDGRLEEARDLLARAVAEEPWDVHQRVELASLLGELGRAEEAWRACEMGLGMEYSGHEWVMDDLLAELRAEAARWNAAMGAAAGPGGDAAAPEVATGAPPTGPGQP